jgi:predicted ATPase
VVWLTGEPGIGKTTVVNAFVEAAAAEGDVWLGRGQCIEHYGVGEAYLPVLEALGRLCRAPEGIALLPVLEQQAPTWLAQMPALLNAAALEAIQRRILGATQERMVREFAEAVEVLTVTRPLLLVLEDLHWSDYATLDLLTYLARRPGPSRLLVLGTYRPVEVLLRGHPLKTVKQELVLHGQAVELPLELLTAAEVAQYLALRGTGGATLPPTLRGLAQLMYQRTDGHPLALVTMVEHLLHRGVLREGAGSWEVQPETAAALREVPASVRQMIEQQFDRLSPAEQRVLEAASVAGSGCAVAAVAAGLDVAMEAVEDHCAGLAQRGQFLVASGIETWPDGTVTERYGWQHALHQEVVYARIPVGRRLRLHRRIGAREETGYGAQASAHAAELAMHFERGQDTARAVRYIQQATDNALQRFAYQEAIDYLRHALTLLLALPETPERVQQELDVQLALGAALCITQGYAAPEVEQTYSRAQILCQQIGETPQFFRALHDVCAFSFHRGALRLARELGEQFVRRAPRAVDPLLRLEVYTQLGITLGYLGDYATAHRHFAQGLALIDATGLQAPASSPSTVSRIKCLVFTAHVLWCLGYPAQAVRGCQQAMALAQGPLPPYWLVSAHFWAVGLYHRCREVPMVQVHAEALLALATTHGFSRWVGLGTVLRGWVLVAQGQDEAGLRCMHQGLAAVVAAGTELGGVRSYCLFLLAEAMGRARQVTEGLRLLAQVRTMLETSGRGDLLAEVYRLQGELVLQSSVKSSEAQAIDAQAEACFQQALAIARRQQAKAWELRAAVSLSRLWQQQGKRDAARALLAPVYSWFTEGFDTADLQEARTLLDGLAGALKVG